MMKQIMFILLLILSISIYGNDNDSIKIIKLQESIGQVKSSLKEIQTNEEITKNQLKGLNLKFDSLQKVLIKTQEELNKASEKFGLEIDRTQTTVQKNIEVLSYNIQTRTIYGIAAFILALIVVLFVYFVLYKRISKGSSTIKKIREMQNYLQEESIKLDDKLLEIFNKQLDLQKVQIADISSKEVSSEPNHSLVLKVADEIVRIEMNLYRMDSSIRGYKQLSKAVERIKNNFLANGYELVDMLGLPYVEGMKVIANFLSDESLKEGEQVITGIIKPQINYNGCMIQSAQITVSQNI